jgi:hypothetical protein
MTHTADGAKHESNGSSDRQAKGGRDEDQDRHDRARRPRLRARDAAERGVGELSDLLGVEPYGVVGMERLGSTWQVTVEVIELERVPETTNIIGVYTVDLDDEGELVGYRRVRRYVRGSAEEES